MNYNQQQNVILANKGFSILNNMFEENGWHLIKNEINWICYAKYGDETNIFDIKIDTEIHVSIPIKNSVFQYVCSFTNYFEASEYIEMRFIDFVGNKKN